MRKCLPSEDKGARVDFVRRKGLLGNDTEAARMYRHRHSLDTTMVCGLTLGNCGSCGNCGCLSSSKFVLSLPNIF